jgi:putative ABC transport system ATP-binding protein
MGNEIMEILLYLNKAENTTVVMVTHDENMAKKTHRLMRLFDGSQVQ